MYILMVNTTFGNLVVKLAVITGFLHFVLASSETVESVEMITKRENPSETDYPYTAAILRKANYLSTGALISSRWVITTARGLYRVREALREYRVRLGSVDYKKGGSAIPIKTVEIHPDYTDEDTSLDIALVGLAEAAHIGASISPIRLHRQEQTLTYTHFLVTTWIPIKRELAAYKKSSRFMVARRLDSLSPGRCTLVLEDANVTMLDSMMCLEQSDEGDDCFQPIGAPVVLNGALWGITSSWAPEECDKSTPVLVTSVAAQDVQPWITDTMSAMSVLTSP